VKKVICIFVLLVALVAAGAAGWLWHGYTSPGPLAEAREVLIARGTGFKAVAHQLEKEGVIGDDLPFVLGGMIEGKRGGIKAGEYAFQPGMSAREVLAKMVRGEVVTRSVTVPEGLTVVQITAMLMAVETLAGEVPKGIEEGTLLPETYQFLRGDSRASIITRMQEGAEKALGEAWEKRAEGLPLASPREALILASIIEKETGVADERKRVASVYVNRLRQGMMLQADPTVAYGIVARDGAMERALTLRDLAQDTPYNTYTRIGLPAGPICNPGRASIEAALQPEETEYLYFVATGEGDGRHYFARTLEEHNANVRRYRAAVR